MSSFQIWGFICCLFFMLLSMWKGPELFHRVAYHLSCEKAGDVEKKVELKFTIYSVLARFSVSYLCCAMIFVLDKHGIDIYNIGVGLVRSLQLHVFICVNWILYSPGKIIIDKDGIREKRFFKKVRFWPWSKIFIHYNTLWGGFHYSESAAGWFDLHGIYIQFTYRNCINGLRCIAKHHPQQISRVAIKKLEKMGVCPE